MTRREFLKKLAAAGVVIASSGVAVKAAEKVLVYGSIPAGTYTKGAILKPKLTYEMLETAYQQCCFGMEEPDLLLLSPKRYAEFVVWLNSVTPDHSRFRKKSPDGELMCPIFNNAAVTYDKNLSDDMIVEINTKCTFTQYSGVFRIPEMNWKPIGSIARRGLSSGESA